MRAMPASKDILVLGAGVIGLSSAIALADRGHRVRMIAKDRTPGTTSDRAGAKFTPFGPSGAQREAGWVRESWRAFTRLAEDGSGGERHGVRMTRAIELAGDPRHTKPWWTSLTRDVRSWAVPPDQGFAGAFEATVPHIDIALYMAWLEGQCVGRGVTIQSRALGSWRELAEERFDVVINCTGLGSRTLVPDALVRPMRGQMLRVTNTTGLNFSIVADRPAPLSRATGVPPVYSPVPATRDIAYIFTFPSHLILGGTFEPDVPEEATIAIDLDAIVERCRGLARLVGHEGWARLGEQRERTWAGIRPARLRADTSDLIEDIRLDLARLPDARPVIHNYGHGRAGITYSWGCAANVVELVEAEPAA